VPLIPRVLSLWRNLVHRRRADDDLDQEVRAAFELLVDEKTRAGMGPDEARRAAVLELGRVDAVKEQVRESRAGASVDTFVHDVRYACRTLRRNQLFAIVAVLILGLSIGANTAIFSIVNAVLIRPLPLAEPEGLVMLFESIKSGSVAKFPVSAPDLLDFQRDQRSFEGLGAYQNREYELGAGGTSERIVGARVTANLFSLLGVEPAAGRIFTLAEDAPGTGVAIISDRISRQTFGSAAAAVGRSILIDRRPHTVVGVMPAGFGFPLPGAEFNARPADIFVPMGFTPFERQGRTLMYNNSVIGRLKPGVTLEQASAELPLLVEGTLDGYPPVVRKGGFELEASLAPLQEVVSGDLRRPLLVMLGAVTLVLLVACANVAGLFLSRAASREHEMGLRVALGASRRRLRQMLLTESLIVALASGGLGLALATWGTGLLPSSLPDSIALPDIVPDARVLAFVVAVSMLTAGICGLAPIVSTRVGDPGSGIRLGGGAVSADGRRLILQKGLVIATVMLSIVLLVTAALMGRSFARLTAVDPGFRSEGVLTMSLRLPGGGYPTGEQVQSFFEQVVERTGSLPGVRAAGAATDLPFVQGERRVFTPDDSPVNEPDAARSVAQTWIVGDYLQAMGIPLVRGRSFTADDRAGRERVAIVSESLARRFWPGADPLGKRIKWGVGGGNSSWMTIVGVVADVRESRLDAQPQIHTYTPYLQVPPATVANEVIGFGMLRSLHLALWTTGDPGLLVEPVRREIQRLDTALAIANVQTMAHQVARSAAPQQATTMILGLLAASALLMAGVGLYGLLAYGLAQRRREIGVRMALGAEPAQVIAMVLGQGLKLVAAGLALGLPVAILAAGTLEALLYETAPRDPWAFAVAPVVLVVAAIAACALPAFRAARVDPVQALRLE
jgi:predicted permease